MDARLKDLWNAQTKAALIPNKYTVKGMALQRT